jgi:DNA-binding transcriptional ArsR family regulator
MALVAEAKDRRKAVDLTIYFHYSGNMETVSALSALGALAQETRLRIFRLLVEHGHAGLPAGDIGRKLGLPPATLSFHVKELATAGLVSARQQGRYIRYAPDFAAMRGLVGYLWQNCCDAGVEGRDGVLACTADGSPSTQPERQVSATPKPNVRPKRTIV